MCRVLQHRNAHFYYFILGNLTVLQRKIQETECRMGEGKEYIGACIDGQLAAAGK